MRSRGLALALLCALALPIPVAADSMVQFDVGLSSTTWHVGDTVTLTPVVTNPGSETQIRCHMWIERYDPPDHWVRMHVASDNCEPWTFVVPPGPLGSYEIVGRALYGLWDGAPVGTAHAPQQFIELEHGGTPAPFLTNYPVQSWALEDIVSTSIPTYGEPLTIFPPATGDNCSMRMLGGFDHSQIYQAGGCEPWTFSIPEREVQGPGITIFGETSDVRVMAWSGDSPYTAFADEPEAGLVGEIYGETYVVDLPDFAPGDAETTEYTSNLPAIFGGRQRTHTGLAGDPTPLVMVPGLGGATQGTCSYSEPPYTTPIVDGACEEPIVVPGWLASGTTQRGVRLELRDDEGTLLSYSDVVIGYVDDMASLIVDAPDTAETNEETIIDASTDAGAPAEYEVVAELETAGTGAALETGGGNGSIVIANGTLDPDEHSDGDAIAVEHAFGAPGRYRVTATFTDVRGETTSGSTIIRVSGVDKKDPVTTKPKNAFASSSGVTGGKAPVRFTWTGTDAGGIDRYQAALSTDGGAWSTISTNLASPTLTRSLSAGHSYRLRVRAIDNAGNVGAWVAGTTFTVRAYQEGSSRFGWTGHWTRISHAGYWGDRARTSSTAGDKVTFTFTGRTLAWVGWVGPTGGSARIYVDGELKKTVSLYSATTEHRRVITSMTWSSADSRKIKIVVVGTPGHPRVDIDAFITGT